MTTAGREMGRPRSGAPRAARRRRLSSPIPRPETGQVGARSRRSSATRQWTASRRRPPSPPCRWRSASRIQRRTVRVYAPRTGRSVHREHASRASSPCRRVRRSYSPRGGTVNNSATTCWESAAVSGRGPRVAGGGGGRDGRGASVGWRGFPGRGIRAGLWHQESPLTAEQRRLFRFDAMSPAQPWLSTSTRSSRRSGPRDLRHGTPRGRPMDHCRRRRRKPWRMDSRSAHARHAAATGSSL